MLPQFCIRQIRWFYLRRNLEVGSLTGFVNLLRWCRVAGIREKLIYLIPHFQDFTQLLLEIKIQPKQISAKCNYFKIKVDLEALTASRNPARLVDFGWTVLEAQKSSTAQIGNPYQLWYIFFKSQKYFFGKWYFPFFESVFDCKNVLSP